MLHIFAQFLMLKKEEIHFILCKAKVLKSLCMISRESSLCLNVVSQNVAWGQQWEHSLLFAFGVRFGL